MDEFVGLNYDIAFLGVTWLEWNGKRLGKPAIVEFTSLARYIHIQPEPARNLIGPTASIGLEQ
jgi:hypothetical protein